MPSKPCPERKQKVQGGSRNTYIPVQFGKWLSKSEPWSEAFVETRHFEWDGQIKRINQFVIPYGPIFSDNYKIESWGELKMCGKNQSFQLLTLFLNPNLDAARKSMYAQGWSVLRESMASCQNHRVYRFESNVSYKCWVNCCHVLWSSHDSSGLSFILSRSSFFLHFSACQGYVLTVSAIFLDLIFSMFNQRRPNPKRRWSAKKRGIFVMLLS